MNRVELARRLARQFRFSRREAGFVVDRILQTLTEALIQGRRIELRGLGTFGVRERRASVGRVVKTGQKVSIPPLKRVYFRPGRELKQIPPPPKSA